MPSPLVISVPLHEPRTQNLASSGFQPKKGRRSALFCFMTNASIMVRVDGDADRGLLVRQALIQVAHLLANPRFARLTEVID